MTEDIMYFSHDRVGGFPRYAQDSNSTIMINRYMRFEKLGSILEDKNLVVYKVSQRNKVDEPWIGRRCYFEEYTEILTWLVKHNTHEVTNPTEQYNKLKVQQELER